jgi:hypothetical protein
VGISDALLTLGVAAAFTLAEGPAQGPDLLPVLPQFALIIGFAGLGGVVGSLVPNPLLAPLTAIVLLYLTQFYAASRLELWVAVGGATAPRSGLHYNPRVVAAQTFLGVGAGFMVWGLHRTGMRGSPSEPAPA